MALPLFILGAYLLGSIPFGYLIAKTKHIDIRKVGSGNIGATNIGRTLGAKYAFVVGLLDFLKGFIPVYINASLHYTQIAFILVGIASLVGHIFPIFLRFKGGKGVATYAGTLVVLLGIEFFMIFVVLWIITLYSTRRMSFTNLFFSLSLPIFLFFTNANKYYTLYTVLAGVLIWWAHRENIKRLYNGTEKTLHLPFIK